jgi:hypothetical protein
VGNRLCSLVVAASAACTGIARAGLIAYFPFTGGSVADASGNGVVATNNGATTAAGKRGQGLSFNGSSSFVNVNLNINAAARPNLTMGAWVKAAAGNGLVSQIISHDNFGFDRSLCIDFRGGTTNSWSAFTGNGVLSGGIPAVVGEWVFLAVVYNQSAGTVRLHVNGQSFTAKSNFNPGYNYLNIGVNPNGNGEYFSGLIDEVFFFDEALSNSQIENLRLNGVPTPGTAGLLALAGITAARRNRRRN